MPGLIEPYDFQDIDFLKTVAAFEAGYTRLLGRWATGLGKSVLLAMLAAHYSQKGRVILMVDVRHLVISLADQIRAMVGYQPGIEMGSRRCNRGGGLVPPDQIVVASFQTMYSMDSGRFRYEEFSPNEFSLVMVDECETVFARNKSRSVVEWFIKGGIQMVETVEPNKRRRS